MKEWREVYVEDISEYVTVGYVGSMSKEYIEKGVLFLRSQNIEPFKLKLTKSTVRYISKKFHNRISKSSLKEGDIAMVRTGYPGTSCVIPPNMGEMNCSDLVIIRPNKKLTDPYFLTYFLNSPLGKASIGGSLVGAAQQHFNVGVAKRIKLKIPSLKTQKKISSILFAYDELIENNDQRINLLEDTAEEIFKEWFVRFRFPGFENSKFQDSEGNEMSHGTDGAIPELWEETKLRSCLKHYIGGGWGEENPNGKNKVPAYVIRGTDFPDFNVGKLNFEVLRYHTKSNLSSRTCIPEDIIFEVSGGTESQSLGRTCFLSEKALKRFNAPVICASFCKLLRIDKSKVSTYYISELLKRMYKTGELSVFQVQSTGISNYQFEDFIDSTRLLIPSKNIQERFEDLIRPLYDEIQILGEKNQILKETRDLLIPRLISGKLSVENLETENLNLAAEPLQNYTN